MQRGVSSHTNGLLIVLRKEYLVQRRQMRLWWRLLLRMAYIVACFFWLFIVMDQGGEFFQDGSGALGWFLMMALAIAQVLPATAGAITREREQGTLEMLLLTRLHGAEILGGKWLAACIPPIVILIFTAAASTVSLFASRFGDDVGAIWRATVNLCLTMLFAGILGIYLSTLFRAFARAVGTAIGILAIQYLLPFIGYTAARLFSSANYYTPDTTGDPVISFVILPSIIFTLGAVELIGDAVTGIFHTRPSPSFKVVLILLGLWSFGCLFANLPPLGGSFDDTVLAYLWSPIITTLEMLVLFFLSVRRVARLEQSR